MYGYDRIIDLIALANLQMRIEHWILTEVLVWTTLGQIAVAIVGFVIAHFLARPIGGRLRAFLARRQWAQTGFPVIAHLAVSQTFPIVALLLLWSLAALASAFNWPHLLLTTCVNLLAVWLVIRLTSGFIRDETWSKFIAIAAFTVATLNILNLLQPTVEFLDGIGIEVGGVYLSLLSVATVVLELAILLWLAMVCSRLLDHRIRKARSLTPSIQVLMGKLMKSTLVVVAFVIALKSIGIDLTAFAVFTGAIGVGIGFGLQKLVSNLISGIILLLDKSIKPGDVIEVGESFGWVSSLGARYASVTTRDGKEWLIPNEDLITQRVVNWSFSHDRLRLPITLGISYHSDVRKAMALAVEGAKAAGRVLKDPEPVCRLMGFGDSSVDLELRIWINDPSAGVINVRSEVLLEVWDRFHANNISIPFPQRDLHIKDGSELNVVVHRARETMAA
jgi:small-conductance mechanosensitive channel